MRRHRTTARGTFLALLFTGLTAAAFASSPASGSEQAVPRLVFPLVAKTLWWDNYGDPRGNGRHSGIPWRAPVVALEPRLEDPRRLRGRLEDLSQPDSHSGWTDERGPVTVATRQDR